MAFVVSTVVRCTFPDDIAISAILPLISLASEFDKPISLENAEVSLLTAIIVLTILVMVAAAPNFNNPDIFSLIFFFMEVNKPDIADLFLCTAFSISNMAASPS